MTEELSHAELGDLLGVYALDALDPDERDHVERHLPGCPSCRTELARHREVLAPLSLPAGPPPTGLWERIAMTLEEPPPPLKLIAPGAPPLRPRRHLRALAAVTAVAAALIVVLGLRVATQERRLDRLQAVTAEDAVERAVLAAIASPAARKVELRSFDGSASAVVAVLPDGRGYGLIDGLPHLSSDRTYQLWALAEGQRISAGTLGPQPEIAVFHTSGNIDGFAITEEQGPGVAASTNAPVLIGWLRQS